MQTTQGSVPHKTHSWGPPITPRWKAKATGARRAKHHANDIFSQANWDSGMVWGQGHWGTTSLEDIVSGTPLTTPIRSGVFFREAMNNCTERRPRNCSNGMRKTNDTTKQGACTTKNILLDLWPIGIFLLEQVGSSHQTVLRKVRETYQKA